MLDDVRIVQGRNLIEIGCSEGENMCRPMSEITLVCLFLFLSWDRYGCNMKHIHQYYSKCMIAGGMTLISGSIPVVVGVIQHPVSLCIFSFSSVSSTVYFCMFRLGFVG